MHFRDIRRVLGRYRHPGALSALYMAGRMALCPYDRLLDDLPRTGDLLDVGCGSGVWLNYLRLTRPELRLSGVDIDPAKIALAGKSTDASIRYALVPETYVPGPESCDALTCMDVFYMFDEAVAARLLEGFFAALRPGGVFLLKDVTDTPFHKHALTRFQELLAVKILGFTKGGGVRIKSADAYVRLLGAAGFADVRARRVDAGYPHPSVAVTGKKPA